MTMWMTLLAWRPFLDPIHLEGYWMWLIVPLVLAITIVYKTIKLDDLSRLPREVAKLTAQILAFMFLAAVLLWLVVELV